MALTHSAYNSILCIVCISNPALYHSSLVSNHVRRATIVYVHRVPWLGYQVKKNGFTLDNIHRTKIQSLWQSPTFRKVKLMFCLLKHDARFQQSTATQYTAIIIALRKLR